MHHSLATLLWLSILIHACCAESREDHQHAKRALTATDLFNILPAGQGGGCTQDQVATLSSWISDATELNNAALSAYGFGLGVIDAANLAAIMGINTADPLHLQSNEDRQRYQFVGTRLGGVQQFLTGHGLPGYPGAKPYFFCNDGFAQHVPWDEPARDVLGRNIPNPEKNYEPFTMAELFPDFVGALLGNSPAGPRSIEPFWIGFANLYTIEPTTVADRRVCYGDLLASTPFPVSVTNNAVFHGLDLHIQGNRQPRYMFFCDNGWRNRGPYYNSMDNLAEITQYANYPVDGARNQNLDLMMPISSTFYHELFHLTDTPATPTRDPYMGAVAIFGAPGQGAAAKQRILDNPESYNYFAVASYLVRHPPQTPPGAVRKPPVVFFGGIPGAV